MTAAIPTTEPATLAAGDTIKWTRALPDYPANDGWSLVYTFINASAKFSATATASGSDHLVTLSAATSGALTAGAYDWRAQASKSGEVYTVASGRATVLPSFSADTLDNRTQARRALEAVESMLEGRASSATHRYEIAGRMLQNYPIPELLMLRDRLRQDVAREDAAAAMAAGRAPRGRIQVRFGP